MSLRIKRMFIGLFIMGIFFLVSGAIEFLLLSIICTFGISLILYIPLAIIIGTIVDKSFIHMKNDKEKVETKTDKNITSVDGDLVLTNNQIALIKYIKESRSRGFSEELIVSELKANNWSEDEIKDALLYAHK